MRDINTCDVQVDVSSPKTLKDGYQKLPGEHDLCVCRAKIAAS